MNFQNHLACGELQWLPAAREPRRLRVLQGLLWITRDGDPDDHWLLPGDALTLNPGERALVQAEAAASFHVLVAVAPRPTSRKLLLKPL